MSKKQQLCISTICLILTGCAQFSPAQIRDLADITESALENEDSGRPLSIQERIAVELVKASLKAEHVDLPWEAVPALLDVLGNATPMPSTQLGNTPTSQDTGLTRPGTITLGPDARSGPLEITDVLDDVTGKSIAGANAPAMLTPSFDGGEMRLRIIGKGFLAASKEDKDFMSARGNSGLVKLFPNDYSATPLNGFLAYTSLDTKPTRSVLLGAAFPLSKVSPSAPKNSDTVLTVSVGTAQIVDLQFDGFHPLVVIVGKRFVWAPIRFGPSTVHRSLAPTIASTRLLPSDVKNDTSFLVQVRGQNLPIDHHLVDVRVNGIKTYYHASFLTETDTIGYIHCDKSSLIARGSNKLTIATPAGIAISPQF